jgi:C1A family cysteine protease
VMMKKHALQLALALLAMLLATSAAAVAEPAISEAPLDPVFREQVASGGGVTQSPIGVQRGSVAGRPSLSAADLPTTYSLRELDLLTDVRDQGEYNTCWAFSTLASLESRLLIDGGTWDLSEDNLVTRSGFGPFAGGPYAAGGTYQMSSAYLARWAGPVVEAADPYLSTTRKPISPVTQHVQGIVLLPHRRNASDNDALKRAVMAHGAVATQMYYTSVGGVYNAATHAFCYTGSADANHGAAIVGWDDSYSADNFTTAPAGDGDFLVRNSWGVDWGDEGYVWVSYYDSVLARTGDSMAISRIDPIGTYTRSYGYDKLGWTDSIGLRNTADSGVARFANHFTAKASEKVAAVAFYAIAPNAAYKVYAGHALGKLTLRTSGTVAAAGYCTVPLRTRMYVAKGKDFVVAVRLDVPATKYPVPLEAPLAGYAATTASGGQSYLRIGGAWRDLTKADPGYSDANVCLKAFTQK